MRRTRDSKLLPMLMAVALAGLMPLAGMSAFPSVAYADGKDIPEEGIFVPAGTEAIDANHPGDALGASWSLSHDGELVIGEDGKEQTITWAQPADMLNRPPW